MKKLNLNKETIAALDNQTMSEVKGGFTYSLSWGSRCSESKTLTAKNGFQCGGLKELNETMEENQN